MLILDVAATALTELLNYIINGLISNRLNYNYSIVFVTSSRIYELKTRNSVFVTKGFIIIILWGMMFYE